MTPKATIQSYESPISVTGTSRAVAKVTQGVPFKFRWQWLSGGKWHTGAENFANDLDHTFNRPNAPFDNVFPGAGNYQIRLQTLDKNGVVTDQTGTIRVITVNPVQVPPIPPDPIPVPPGTVTKVHPDGHVWRKADGSAWRWKGVSAFQLCDRWLRAEDLTPFLNAYQGYNTLRVWSYVEGPNWTDPTWNSPTADEAVAFVKEMNRLGWYVEWTLKTSSQTSRNAHALDEIHAFTAANLPGLFLEGANEPEVQNPDSTFIDCGPLKSALEASGYPYTNGCYTEGAKRWWGTYITCHTQRDAEWPRRSHDAYDLWVKPADAPAGAQAVHAPCILDEPAKTQDVSGDHVSDWKAYFGSGAFFSAGVTFHSKTGKFAQPPTAEEAQLAASALVGLGAFPADAPADFRYSRVTDNTLRTYIMGNCMVRIRPTTLQAPQPGWTMIDSAGILWRR